MAKSLVGVDFGSREIRAAEVTDLKKARPTLVRYGEIPLPPSSALRGEVVEVDTVASALRQLWSKAGFKSKDVVLGVGNQRVLARDLTVPKMPLQQIRESLPFQVQDMLPVPVVDALLDFYPVSEGIADGVPVINGLLVAAVKEAVMGNVRAVQAAGLNPVEVDLIPFALSRALIASAATRETVAMVDVGAVTTTVVVATGGVPQFVRIIPAGGDEVTAALVSRLELAPPQADEVKRAFGLTHSQVSPEWGQAVEIVREVTLELLNSLRNTLNFYMNTRPTEPISRVVLSGGGAKLIGFSAALGEMTRIQIAPANPVERFTLAKTLGRSSFDPSATGMSVALGLTLGGI